MASSLKKISQLYRIRFSDKEINIKHRLWKVLCQEFLQNFVSSKDTVLDLGAGYCDFINNIKCKNKIAVDLNPATKEFAHRGIKVLLVSSTKLPQNLTAKIDIVFAGCFLEHLLTKDDLFKTFTEVWRILRPGGRFLILNPNIRFSTSDFWDYYDHFLPLSDRSVAEGLQLANFEIEKIIPKFVPNTIKDALPKSPILLKIYLHTPMLFPIFGRQMFIVAKKSKDK